MRRTSLPVVATLLAWGLLCVDSGHSQTTINVRLFGAKGDGVTDDRAAIQRACDSGYARKVPVYIPAGVYLVSMNPEGAMDINLKPGAHIYGDGSETIIQRMKGSSIAYAIGYYLKSLDADSSKNNFTIRDLQIVGGTGGRRTGRPPDGTGGDGGIVIGSGARTRSYKVVIENVIVRDVSKEAIAVWDADHVTIRNCKVFNCNHDAFNPAYVRNLVFEGNYADSVAFGVEYSGNPVFRTRDTLTTAVFRNNEFDNIFEYGIRIYAGDNVTIDGNILHQAENRDTSSTHQATGIFFTPDNPGNGWPKQIGTVEVSRNLIDGFYTTGIGNTNLVYRSTDPKTRRIVIRENVISHSGGSGVHFGAYDATKCGPIEIVENTITTWNRVTLSNSYIFSGIRLSNIDSILIANNKIWNDRIGSMRNDPVYLERSIGTAILNNDCSGKAAPVFVNIKSVKPAELLVQGNTGLSGIRDFENSTIIPEKASSSEESKAPDSYWLGQNYPNPFNPVTSITYQLPRKAHVALRVFNLLGQLVKSLFEGEMPPGRHNVEFDSNGLASGVYIYRIESREFSAARRCLLVR